MRRYYWLTYLLLCFSLPLSGEETLSGRPLKVLGGDRLVLLGQDGNQYRIRLSGISTRPTDQFWGAAAKRYLSTLVMGRFLIVQYRRPDPDGYVPALLLHGGADLNIRLIQAGLATHDPAGQTQAERISYAAAQQKASQSGQGFWGQGNGTGAKRGRSMPGGPLFRILR
jgi:endonuclease YncB( thermonuclease family)